MEFAQSKNANINYLARVVDIKTFEPHPNANKMKIASVGGYKVCVGIDEQEGRFIYFPTNCKINPNLLSFCNLYRHGEKNLDPQKTGFFEDNGRVTAIKLRGVPSEGFLLPYQSLNDFTLSNFNKTLDNVVNVDFDILIEGGKEVWICQKYIVQKVFKTSSNPSTKKVSKFDKIIDTQFRFHYQTAQVKHEPWFLSPNDLISITTKVHGTSGISAYVLCKEKRNWLQKIWDKIVGSVAIKYDYIYASRTVVKNKEYNTSVTSGYYNCDVWAEADKILRPYLSKGLSLYYEIVGFLPNGGYIQKNYDYGCIPPKEGEEYTYGKHFKIFVYRVTLTDIDGLVHEFSAKEVQEWCTQHSLDPVIENYYGLAKNLYPELQSALNDNEWRDLFWDKLANDKAFNMECFCPICANKVPFEGLVIKKEDMRSRAWKLKCFNFLNSESKQLDAGEENIEDNA